MPSLTPATAASGTAVSNVTQHIPLVCSDNDPLLCSDSLECSEDGPVAAAVATGSMVAA